MRWKLYYSDGSTFSDEDGLPEDAPYRDVQVVLVKDSYYPDGRRLHHGRDGWFTGYFHHHGKDSWVPHDVPGLLDCLERRGFIHPGTKFQDVSLDLLDEAGVKVGRSIADDDFDAILREALNDPDIPSHA